MSGATDPDQPRLSLKTRREINELREERVKRARIIVDDAINKLKMDAATMIATRRREQLARCRPRPPPPVAVPARSLFDDFGVDDRALAEIEIPPPKPVPPVVPQLTRAPYAFDRKAARAAALGKRHADALERIEEQAGNIEEMPSFRNYDVRSYLCSRHLSYDQRFIVLTFLTMNRVPPILVVELMLAAGMLADQAAFDHTLSMLKKMAYGNFSSYKAWCMESRMWEEVQPPIDRGVGRWLLQGADWGSAVYKLRSSIHSFFGVRRAR